MRHELPQLLYPYDALEPHIDARTMEIHHAKHHQGYVDKLNAALEGHADLTEKSLEKLLRDLNSTPEEIRTAVRNNGGGHYNHSLFWRIMSPQGGEKPIGQIAKKIEAAFGNFENFKNEFTKAAIARFGSGWTWLIMEGKVLRIISTPNQDSPVMEGLSPILCLDVWEHAYYLKYQNRRADYIAAWWNVLDWGKVDGVIPYSF